ncbi:MAG: DUF349 domain-containing protein, partial [Bacteroidales bacterium]|nr:DUF349 domain-containing protein [Bacteroidales bacterium]
MESKELLHPEDVENQSQEVNSDASQEGQISTQNEEQPEPEMHTSAENVNIVEPKNPIVESEPASVKPVSQSEPVEVAKEEVIEPIVVEESPDPVVELHESVENMMADIEHHQSMEELTAEEDEEIDVDNQGVKESIEHIEAKYADLSFEDAVTALENVVRDTDHNKTKLRVGVLKSNILKILKAEKQQQLEKFLEEGGVKEEFVAEISNLERRFNQALHIFKDNKVKFLEEVDKQKQKNLKAKQAVIEGLKNLVENESNLKILNDNFKNFQEQWKEIGPVSANESGNLWNTYHYYVDKFFDILKINRELRSLDLKKNLELKINICERAESLLLQDSINKSFKELQQLHDEWKEVGPVSDDKKEEIWERFKMATNQINSNRRAYYDKIYSEQQT